MFEQQQSQNNPLLPVFRQTYIYDRWGNRRIEQAGTSEVMLQWNENGSWEHRAYWGANTITIWGVDGTASRKNIGPLPPTGQWVRLEVPASAVGLEGKTVSGMAFTLYGGRANWDKAGKARLVNNGAINGRAYTVDPVNNRLTAVDGVMMSYDAAGNQTNDGSGLRKYDGENRMVEAYNADVLVSQYVYDADGKRVRRIIGGQETCQVYGMGGELLAEYAAGAAPSVAQKEYGYRNGQLLVVWDGSEMVNQQLKWLVQDHLGSTRMVVDRSGSLGGVRRNDFLPFGEELGSGIGLRSASIGYGDDSVRQKFTGEERDDETGLDFFGARYYASVQGRFTSPDEFNPILGKQGADDKEKAEKEFRQWLSQPARWNRYAYCLNNPVSCIDPDGMDPITVNLNIIYDQGSNYTEEEKKRIRQTYIEQAQKRFGTVDIKFNVTETVGSAINLGSETRQSIASGAVEGAVNVFFTKSYIGSSSEVSRYHRGDIFINTVRGPDPSDLTHGLIHVFGIASGVNGYWATPRNLIGASFTGIVPGFAEYRTQSVEYLLKRKESNYYGNYYYAKTGLEPIDGYQQRALRVIRQGAQRYLHK